MRIGPHAIGERVYVIAEAGINHNGRDILAHRLIEAAKDAGADAVKFQMFHTNALIRRRGDAAGFLSAYEFPSYVWPSLKSHCDDLGLTFLASIFDEQSAHEYFRLQPAAVKIGSGELHVTELLNLCAGRPTILSTGMAALREVKEALEYVGPDVALLHCVSAYPTPLNEVNLRAMDALRVFEYPVGFSDHTIGTAVALAAVARGATIIEKHLTLDTTMAGPDHKASANPSTFKAMVDGIRMMEAVLGDGEKRVMPSEVATRQYCRHGGVEEAGPARRGDGVTCQECGEALPKGSVATRRFCSKCRDTRHLRAQRTNYWKNKA